MANPNYTDRTLDPSEREYGSLLSERPDLMNFAYMGFARTVTPKAWLSTWSLFASNADLARSVAQIAAPTLMVHAACDREIYPAGDVRPVWEAVAAKDKTFVEIPGARHYFEPEFGQTDAPDVERLMDVVVPWIRARFPE
jgi:pimeloyl-ACP methyl ester carboxylesterase